MTEICVVHLVRACNGLEPFEKFLRSYSQHPAGIDHDLILVFKGFRNNAIPREYLRAASDIRYRSLFVQDWGFDLRPYGLVARLVERPYFCFLNSFSEPLVSGWLENLNHSLHQPDVGLVGATGSWESMYSNLFVKEQSSQRRSLVERLWWPVRVQLCKRFFEPFPNWHLRTNAILIARDIVLRCWPSLVMTKRSAYLFENGRKSLTRQVLQMGLEVLVVGRDGRAYAKEDWPHSRTYRAGKQENLLVSDTQTQRFAEADFTMRRHLAFLAWGEQAEVTSS